MRVFEGFTHAAAVEQDGSYLRPLCHMSVEASFQIQPKKLTVICLLNLLCDFWLHGNRIATVVVHFMYLISAMK